MARHVLNRDAPALAALLRDGPAPPSAAASADDDLQAPAARWVTARPLSQPAEAEAAPAAVGGSNGPQQKSSWVPTQACAPFRMADDAEPVGVWERVTNPPRPPSVHSVASTHRAASPPPHHHHHHHPPAPAAPQWVPASVAAEPVPSITVALSRAGRPRPASPPHWAPAAADPVPLKRYRCRIPDDDEPRPPAADHPSPSPSPPRPPPPERYPSRPPQPSPPPASPVVRKRAVLPAAVMEDYPGFCDASNLAPEERRPWKYLAKNRQRLEQKEKEKREKEKKLAASPPRPTKPSITPTSWKERRLETSPPRPRPSVRPPAPSAAPPPVASKASPPKAGRRQEAATPEHDDTEAYSSVFDSSPTPTPTGSPKPSPKASPKGSPKGSPSPRGRRATFTASQTSASSLAGPPLPMPVKPSSPRASRPLRASRLAEQRQRSRSTSQPARQEAGGARGRPGRPQQLQQRSRSPARQPRPRQRSPRAASQPPARGRPAAHARPKAPAAERGPGPAPPPRCPYDPAAARAYIREQRRKRRQERERLAEARAAAERDRLQRLEQLRTISQQLVRASSSHRRHGGSAPAPDHGHDLEHNHGQVHDTDAVIPQHAGSQQIIHGQKDRDFSDYKIMAPKIQISQRPTMILKPQLRGCAFQEMPPDTSNCIPSDLQESGDHNSEHLASRNTSLEPSSNEVPQEVREVQGSEVSQSAHTEHSQQSEIVEELENEVKKLHSNSSTSHSENSRIQPHNSVAKGKIKSTSASPLPKTSSSTSPHPQHYAESSTALKNTSLKCNSKSRSPSSSNAANCSSTSERPSTCSPNRARRQLPRDVTSVLVTQIEKLNRYVDEFKEDIYFKKSQKHSRSRRSLEKDFKIVVKDSKSPVVTNDVLSTEQRCKESSDQESQSFTDVEAQKSKSRHHLKLASQPILISPRKLTGGEVPHLEKDSSFRGIGNLNDFVRNLAATKIQAYYRGYKVRKNLKTSHKLKCDNTEGSSLIKIKHLLLSEDQIKIQENETGEEESVKKAEQLPGWLQPPPILDCPYNFMTALRKKMAGLSNTQENISPRTAHQKDKSIQTIDHKEVQTVDPVPASSTEESVQVPDDATNLLHAEFGKHILSNKKETVFRLENCQKPLDIPSTFLRRGHKEKSHSDLLLDDVMPITFEQSIESSKIKSKGSDLKPDSDIGEEFHDSTSERLTPSSHSDNIKNFSVNDRKKKKGKDNLTKSVKPTDLSGCLKSFQNVSERLVTDVLKDIQAGKPEHASFTSLEHDKASGDDTETNVSSIISQVASEGGSDQWILPKATNSGILKEASAIPSLSSPDLALKRKSKPIQEKKDNIAFPAKGECSSAFVAVPVLSPRNVPVTPELYKSCDVSSHSSVNVSKISEKAVQILLEESAEYLDENKLPSSGSSSPIRTDLDYEKESNEGSRVFNDENASPEKTSEKHDHFDKSCDVSSHSSVNVSKISEKAVQILLEESPKYLDENKLPFSGSSRQIRTDLDNEKESKEGSRVFNDDNASPKKISEIHDHFDLSLKSENKITDLGEFLAINESANKIPSPPSKSSKDNKVTSLHSSGSPRIASECISAQTDKNLTSVSKISSANKAVSSGSISVLPTDKSDASQEAPEIPSDDNQPQPSSVASIHHTQQSTSSIQPGQVLPPAALHMQFRAELQLFDSLDTSCHHLEKIENLHALTMAQQNATNLATTLKATIESQQLAERFAKEREEFERVLKKVKRWNTSGSDDSGSVKSKSSPNDVSTDHAGNIATSGSSAIVSEEYGDTGGFESSASSSAREVKEISKSLSKQGGESVAKQVVSSKSIQGSITAKSSTEGSTGHSFTSMSMDLEPDFSGTMGSHKILSETIPPTTQPPPISLNLPPALNIPNLNFQQTERLLQTEPILATTYFMYEQMLRHEELRAEEQATVLNMKERSLLDRARAAMALLEARKRELRAKGKEQQVPALKKKQRALVLRLQHDREEIRRQRKAHKAAVEERRNALAQLQQRLLQLQLARHVSISATVPRATSSNDHSHQQGSSESHSKHNSRTTPKATSHTVSVSTEVPTKVSTSARSSIPVVSSAVEVGSQASSASASSVKSSAHSQSLEDKIMSYLKTLDHSKRRLTEHQRSLLAHSLEELLHSQKKLDNIAPSNINSRFHNDLQDRGTSPVVVFEKTSLSEVAVSITSATGVDEDGALSPYAKSSHQSNSSVPEEIQTRASDSSSQDGKQPIDPVSQTSLEVASSQIHTHASVSSEEIPEEASIHSRRSQPTLGRVMGQPRRHSADAFLRSISPLPPLPPAAHKRRYSSGSDESIIYSQTETPSEQSDLEGRVSALLEQLRRRRMEADKLRREHKRSHRERLKAKEQSLLKQIQAYDDYIQKTREEIQKELDSSTVSSASFSKPKIKQPCNASRSRDRLSFPIDLSDVVMEDSQGMMHKDKVGPIIETQPSEASEDLSKHSQSLSHTPTENISIGTAAVGDSNKSHEDTSLPEEPFPVEEVVAEESSYSSIVSEIAVSTAISVSFERETAVKDAEMESSSKSTSVESSVKTSELVEITENEKEKQNIVSSIIDTPEKPEEKLSNSIVVSTVIQNEYAKGKEMDKLIADVEEKSSDSSDEKSSVTVIDEKLSYISEEIPVTENSSEKSVTKIGTAEIDMKNDVSFEKPAAPDTLLQVENICTNEKEDDQNNTNDYSESFELTKTGLDTALSAADIEKSSSHKNKIISGAIIESSDFENKTNVQEEATEIPSDISPGEEESQNDHIHLEEEDEHVTISSGDISEEHGEPPHIIKVFISEKVSKSNENSITSQVFDSPKEKELEIVRDLDVETEIAETSIIEPCAIPSPEKLEEGSKCEENIKSFVAKEKLLNARKPFSSISSVILSANVEIITDDIFKNLLKDVLQTDVSKKTSPDNDRKLKKSKVDIEVNVNEGTGVAEEKLHQNVDEYLDSALDTFYKTTINDETFTKESLHDVSEEPDSQSNLNITYNLLNEEMCDATDIILNIMEKKKNILEESYEKGQDLINSQSMINDVRKRVSEILAETALNNSARESPRLQDLLTTTYDVLSSPSPEESIFPSGFPSSPTHHDIETDFWGNSSSANAAKEAELVGSDNAAFLAPPGGDLWFEDALLPAGGGGAGAGPGAGASAGAGAGAGASVAAVAATAAVAAVAVTVDEAEALRLQQLHIEREIRQLQQAQEQVPFFYVREIPNKPPPPYTPPGLARVAAAASAGLGDALGARPPPPPPPLLGAPRPDQAAELLDAATALLADAAAHGRPLERVAMPEGFGRDADFDKLVQTRANGAAAATNRRAYASFLFDLARAAVREEWQSREGGGAAKGPAWRWPAVAPPRLRPPGPPSAEAAARRARRALEWARAASAAAAAADADEDATGARGGPGAGAPQLRWSRRRRDRVDELLTREARDEEPAWTRYDEEEAALKNEVTEQVLGALLDDAARALQRVLERRAASAEQHR